MALLRDWLFLEFLLPQAPGPKDKQSMLGAGVGHALRQARWPCPTG